MADEEGLPCPACGFLVFEQAYGSFDICPVCDWEDDGVQLANPCSGGGANRDSLAEAQAAALLKFPLAVRQHGSLDRSTRWRPLSEVEREEFTARAKKRHWSEKAITSETESYWSRTW